jgi:hypothetical protein
MKKFVEFVNEETVSGEIKARAFHGTNVDIDKFKGVSYFSPNKDAAEGYARGKVNIHKKGSARVYEVDLHFKNPHVVHSMQQIGSIDEPYMNKLRERGHDGVVYKGNHKEPIPEYLPLHPHTVTVRKVHSVN